MDENEKQSLKKIIADEIVKTQEEIDALEKSTESPEEISDSVGRLGRMDELNAREVNTQALSLEKDKMQKLEAAIARVDDDDFGICESCEEPIPFERLKLVPESTFCVKCANAVGGC